MLQAHTQSYSGSPIIAPVPISLRQAPQSYADLEFPSVIGDIMLHVDENKDHKVYKRVVPQDSQSSPKYAITASQRYSWCEKRSPLSKKQNDFGVYATSKASVATGK